MKANCIWSMRYKDKMVLVDMVKITLPKTYVFFACDRNHLDLYSVDGERVKRECSNCSNGKIRCYEIPFEWFENEGELPSEYLPIRESEYAKYKKYMSKSQKK